MKTIKISIFILLVSLTFSCQKSKDRFRGMTAIGIVSQMNTGVSASKPGVTPYNIVFADGLDSILVTNLPQNFSVGAKIKFSYEEGDTLSAVFLTDRIYPKRATLISVVKQ